MGYGASICSERRARTTEYRSSRAHERNKDSLNAGHTRSICLGASDSSPSSLLSTCPLLYKLRNGDRCRRRSIVDMRSTCASIRQRRTTGTIPHRGRYQTHRLSISSDVCFMCFSPLVCGFFLRDWVYGWPFFRHWAFWACVKIERMPSKVASS
jgi:hypothetical protein